MRWSTGRLGWIAAVVVGGLGWGSIPGRSQGLAAGAAVQAAGATGAEPTPEEAGDALMEQKRYQAAIEAYGKMGQKSAEVLNRMGIAYQMMFSLKNAERCYLAALKLEPKNAQVLNNLGTVYDSQRQFGDAERAFRKAIRLDAHSAITYKNLGTALLAQKKFKRGWEAYQQALAIDPHIFEDKGTPKVDNPGPVENRGAMNYYMARGCARAGMNDYAIEYLRMALNERFTTAKKLRADREFESLKGVPAFEQLLAGQGPQ